ncbi:hypothetical protein EV129_102360 [Rhizobium azibense]|nr:hypothetical protein EV129_102360 [Rhizobium azibense]
MRLYDFGSVGEAYQRYSDGYEAEFVTSWCSKSWPASRLP